MHSSRTRRAVLRSSGLIATTSLAGCFGAGRMFGPGEGEIFIVTSSEEQADLWVAGQTFRIVGRTDGEVAFEESYELPVGALDLTVPPDTYQIVLSVGGDEITTYEWEVTSCKDQLLLEFLDSREDGIHVGTSNC